MKAALLVDSKCILAEGIQWCAERQRLWWTDIHGRALWSCDANGGAIEKRETPERLGSFAFDPVGCMLAAFESGLFRWDLEAGHLERLNEFEPGHASSRLNDGRCDREGRFIVGGVDEDGLKQTTTMIRYQCGRTESIYQGIVCANSICFSPNGNWMYFTDTPTRTILRFPYEGETGEIGAPTIFLKVTDPAAGFPDGSCVDRDGALWNARFNGARVQQILPSGDLGQVVELPVPQVTCACFGGEKLDRLYITTARENMSEADVAAHPLSGGIFVAEPGAIGLIEDRYMARMFPI